MLGRVRGAGALGVLLLGLAGAAQGADPQVLARGKTLFSTVQPACALCHTLKAAASSGQVGRTWMNCSRMPSASCAWSAMDWG